MLCVGGDPASASMPEPCVGPPLHPRTWKPLSAGPTRLSASTAVPSGRISAARSSGLVVKGSAAFQATRQADSHRSACAAVEERASWCGEMKTSRNT